MRVKTHTPGPWHYRWSMAGCWLLFIGEDQHRAHLDPEREADARLISSAPDLLRALQDALPALQWAAEREESFDHLYSQAEKAVHDATKGRQWG